MCCARDYLLHILFLEVTFAVHYILLTVEHILVVQITKVRQDKRIRPKIRQHYVIREALPLIQQKRRQRIRYRLLGSYVTEIRDYDRVKWKVFSNARALRNRLLRTHPTQRHVFYTILEIKAFITVMY
jgi:hypothetical protein